MLYRDNEVLIFDEPTAVLTPQEIEELMKIMKELTKEGKSILFITHKLDEIKAVADRCTVLRKGKYVGTVDVATTSKEELSEMMVGRKVQLVMEKTPLKPGESVLTVQNLTVRSKKHGKPVVNNVSFNVHRGEIVCIAGIDGNGQSELVYALTGLMKPESGKIFLNNKDITHMSIRKRNEAGLSHIPEDRHKHGLVLDYSLENNLVLKRYFHPEFERNGFLQFGEIRKYADELIDRFDVRSGQGAVTKARSMSGGNQQKAIIAREVDLSSDLLIAVQPTRGLDVGAIEYIRKELLAQRDAGKAVLLVSLELDEVLEVPDRILVMYEGAIVGELDPRYTTARAWPLHGWRSAQRLIGGKPNGEQKGQAGQPSGRLGSVSVGGGLAGLHCHRPVAGAYRAGHHQRGARVRRRPDGHSAKRFQEPAQHGHSAGQCRAADYDGSFRRFRV